MFPSAIGETNFLAQLSELSLSIDQGVEQYLGVIECDPHLMWMLLKLRNFIKDLGANPDHQDTVVNFKPSLLLSLGTGDGTLLKEMIKTLQPYHLCIAVRSWEDLESSFEVIDWCNVWNERCQNNRYKISLLPYSSFDQLQSTVVKHSLVSCEHAFVVVPGPSTPNIYKEDREALSGHEMLVAVSYLGFTIDEYNMLWNSMKTLKRQPKLFKTPVKAVGGKYIVCGSGPSLDKNISVLKNLPPDWSIIACASNYRTLRSAGIDVDILCLLERGSYEYENYLSIQKEYGLGHTHLFASVTCDSRLLDLFENSVVYFRPALTPLSVFCSSTDQVLNFEGPQTVNTGVALCRALKADEVVLVGVDLGAVSLDKVRSSAAVGSSDRTFDKETKGNYRDSVYTCNLLLDGKLSMERCIKQSPSMHVVNASDGVFIEGAEPLCSDLYDFIHDNSNALSDQKPWIEWWSRRTSFNSKDFKDLWIASRPRANVSDTIRSIKTLLLSDDPWFPVVQDKLHELLRLDVPLSAQVGRRLVRGVLIKTAIVISRQCYSLLARDSTGALQEKFLVKSRQQMTALCDQLEAEIYELFDLIELELSD